MKASEKNLTIFRLYLNVIRKESLYLIIYFLIFTAIAVLISNVERSEEGERFAKQEVLISVIDNDKSVISNGLIAFLDQDNEVELSDGDKTELTRKMYYREIRYVLTIPEGFGKALAEDPESAVLDTVKLPGAESGYYIDAEIEQFIARFLTYIRAGYTEEEAMESVLALSNEEADVRVAQGSFDYSGMPSYSYIMQYLPYLYLSVMIYCVSFVMKTFREKNIENRLRACPIPARKRTLQSFAAFALLTTVVYVLSFLIPLIAKGPDFYTCTHRDIYLVNALLFLLVSASIAFFIGSLVRSDAVITALTNVIGLGFCFLGGVFVSLDVLNVNVQRFSRFLPTYWYVRVVNALAAHAERLTASDISLIQSSFLIQGAFAAAVLALTLYVSGRMQEG